MAYEIINRFIPASLYSLKAPYTMKPEYITFHNTANDAAASGEISYMTSNRNATSYHVAIDDKYAIQAIPFSRMAWHCGDGLNGTGNRKSIGVEVCYSKSGGAKYYAAERNAIEYIAHVLVQYGWGVDRVKWHRDWSGKNCPHRVFAEKREHAVRKAIADKVAEIKRGSVASKPSKPTPKPVVKPAPAPEPAKPKEDEDMHESAVIVNTTADLGTAALLAQQLNCGIFFRRDAEQRQVAKTIYIAGGGRGKLKGDKFVDLSGKTRQETAKNVADRL